MNQKPALTVCIHGTQATSTATSAPPDPVADLSAMACLSLKDRRKHWFATFNKMTWEGEVEAEESLEQSCRDAKALDFGLNSVMAHTKQGEVTLMSFLVDKARSVYGMEKAIAEVERTAKDVGLPHTVLQLKQEVPEFHYDRSTRLFWCRAATGVYQCVTKETALDMLSMAGLSVAKEENGMPSAAHRHLLEVINEHGVDWAGALAGYPVGPVEVKGRALLVTRSINLPKPAADEGDEAPHVLGLIDGLLGDQSIYLHLHLNESYEALRDGRKGGSVAVIIVGPADSGKTLLLDYVITPLLGGRKANAYSFLSGKTNFNDEQIGCEVHAIDDGNPFDSPEARKQFGNAVKQEVANNEAWCHPKGKPAFTAPIYRRLFILANPEDMALMPELDDSMDDKLIMLKAQPFSMPTGCLPLPDRNTPGAREAFVAKLQAELPAYIAALGTLGVVGTKDMRARRFGLTAFKDESLVAQLDELSSTNEKHAVIQKALFKSREYRTSNTVELEVSELYEILLDGSYKDRAAKLFRNVRSLGTALGLLGKKLSHYERRKSNGECLWAVKRDSRFDKTVNSDPE